MPNGPTGHPGQQGTAGVKALIFLDIDGVLNDHTYNNEAGSNTILPHCMEQLNRIIRETDALIVISSAWRYMISEDMTLKGFNYLMRTHGLSCIHHGLHFDRIIGRTTSDETTQGRGEQIMQWLSDQEYNWIAIDDMSELYGDFFDKSRLVCPKGSVGLTEVERIKAIQLLREVAHV